MREVILAKTAGFCFGVKRAIDTVYDKINSINKDNVRVYTYGPIIHNEEVVEDLKKRGVGGERQPRCSKKYDKRKSRSRLLA